MSINPAVKVGIIILLAVVSFILAMWFLQGYSLERNVYRISVIFDDAMGVTDGSLVKMAGVTIGEVKNIRLNGNNRAVLDLRINRIYRIPKGSRFTMDVGLLVGEKSINIIPKRESNEMLSAGDTVLGEQPTRIEDLLPKAQKLMADLEKGIGGLNSIVGDRDNQERIVNILKNLEAATDSMNEAMKAIGSEKNGIHAIIANVQAASRSLKDLTAEIERMVKSGEVQGDIRGTLKSARNAAESLERMTDSMEKLVTEPQFQEDIKETAAGAREAVEKAKDVLDHVDEILPGEKFLKPGDDPNKPTRHTSLEIITTPEDGNVIPVFSTSLSIRDSSFVKLGLYDVGGDNRLIFQPGNSLSSRADLRYGVYASKLGLGLDYNFSPNLFGTVDVYDTDDLRTDFRAGLLLNDNFGLLLGVDDAFDESRFTLGARYQK